MLEFLKPAPVAKKKVPADKVESSYHWHQLGVLLAICIGYIGYYIIRLIFITEQNEIMKQYGFTTADIEWCFRVLGLVMGFQNYLWEH